MKTKLMALMLLAGGAMFAQTRFSVGVNIGGNRGYYTQAPAYASAIPPCPGPGYTWVDGYWSQSYGRRNWTAGYWAPPVYYNNYSVERRRYDRDDFYRRDYRDRHDNGRHNGWDRH